MWPDILIFIVALAGLLIAARFFTQAAEEIGTWLRLPAFVIGVFIVGIGTSLPELVSGVISVVSGASEILPGNIVGANISNILLVMGLAVAINRRDIVLNSSYIYIDLHFLIGSLIMFGMVAYDGRIEWLEASAGLVVFMVYSVYLIRSGASGDTGAEEATGTPGRGRFPLRSLLILLVAMAGIYFGASYTISSIQAIATALQVPQALIALTLLSLGTTLPELAVNITALREGKAEMAVGNVLGSCIFNTLMIPGIASMAGTIQVPDVLLSFSLPVMMGAGLLFYLLTQDKRISGWEGMLFVLIYFLFLLKTAGV